MGSYPTSVAEQVRLIKKYGFEAAFSLADSPTLEEEIEACKAAGIVHENLHAPFRRINDMWLDKPEGDAMLASLKRAVDSCQRHAIPTLVVHLSSGARPPRINPLGISRFEELMAHARAHDVRIAYENQRLLSNLALAFEEFPDAYFCYDTGHQWCFTANVKFLPIFGPRTIAIHVHDNHAIYNGDEHLLPYDGVIDLDAAMRDLAATPYDGAIMLEVVATHSPYYGETSADEYYARAAAAANKLREAFLSARK